jgi:hypothetical protein
MHQRAQNCEKGVTKNIKNFQYNILTMTHYEPFRDFFLQRHYGWLRPNLFCWFLHKSRRDDTAGWLVFCHVHTKTRNPNFSTPENTKIEFASSRIDWSGNAGWLHMGMRSLSLVAWPVNPAPVEANSISWLGIGICIFLCMHIGATFGRTPRKAHSE